MGKHSMAPAPLTKAQLLGLMRELSYQRGTVKLSSGDTSDFYVDCKQTALHPDGAWTLGAELLRIVEDIEWREWVSGGQIDGVGGMALGAAPLATSVSLYALSTGRRLPAFIVRKEPKGHGTGRWIEGWKSLPPGSKVVLLEDVITTGGSTLRAIDRVIEEGLVPVGVAAILDRQAGGMQIIEEQGLPVRAIFTREDFEGKTAT